MHPFSSVLLTRLHIDKMSHFMIAFYWNCGDDDHTDELHRHVSVSYAVCAAVYPITIALFYFAVCCCCHSLIHISDFYFWFLSLSTKFLYLAHSCTFVLFSFYLVHHDGANALHTSFQWQVTSFFCIWPFSLSNKRPNKKHTHRTMKTKSKRQTVKNNETKRNRTFHVGNQSIVLISLHNKSLTV